MFLTEFKENTESRVKVFREILNLRLFQRYDTLSVFLFTQRRKVPAKNAKGIFATLRNLRVFAWKNVLRFLRINDPYRLLAILFFLIVFSLPLMINPPVITKPDLRAMVIGEALENGQLMYAEVYDPTAPLAAGAFGAIDWMMDRSVMGRQIIALVLIFFQAAFFGILLINNKAYNDNTYVPGFIYGLLCFVSFDFLSVTPELLGSTVLLLALNNLFREIEFRVERDGIIVNVGFYIGLASIFVFTYSIFLVAAFVILFVFTRISFRKSLLLLFGFFLPHVILVVLYFYKDALPALWNNFYLENVIHTDLNLISGKSLLLLGALPVTYFVCSLFMMTREARFTKYQSQLFQVMFLWIVFCVIEIFLTRQLSPHSLIIMIPSLAYFFSHYLLLIRRRWIAEMMLWVLIIGIISISNLGARGNIGAIDYSRMFVSAPKRAVPVTDKKVMVLGDDLSIYRNNTLGGYFLHWPLSERTLNGIQYYDNVLKIDRMLQTVPPDVIVDQIGMFDKLAARIPSLGVRYKKEKESIYVRTKL
jgi:hypothetical protein